MLRNFETSSHDICNRTFNSIYPCHEAWCEQIHYNEPNTRSHFSGPFSIRSILSRSSNSKLEVYESNQLELSVREQNKNENWPALSYSSLFYQGNTHRKAAIDEIEPCSSQFRTPVNSSRWLLEKDGKEGDDKDKKSGKKNNKRTRTIFTPSQLQRLEKEFSGQQYVAGEERKELAAELQLTETQVKVWFQNRRIRFRKQNQRVMKSPEITEPLHTSDQHRNSPY